MLTSLHDAIDNQFVSSPVGVTGDPHLSKSEIVLNFTSQRVTMERATLTAFGRFFCQSAPVIRCVTFWFASLRFLMDHFSSQPKLDDKMEDAKKSRKSRFGSKHYFGYLSQFDLRMVQEYCGVKVNLEIPFWILNCIFSSFRQPINARCRNFLVDGHSLCKTKLGFSCTPFSLSLFLSLYLSQFAILFRVLISSSTGGVGESLFRVFI